MPVCAGFLTVRPLAGLSHRTTRALHGYSVVVVASGQLYVWDMRHKGLPVQRSKLSTRSHTYPVYWCVACEVWGVEGK
jgi:hypothetical protein